MPRVLVAGATGVIGAAAVEHLLAGDRHSVIALSRRRWSGAAERAPEHVNVDLLDSQAARAAVGGLGGVTHLVYAALHEKPGLVEGWRDREQMASNLEMLRHCLEPLLESSSLRHVTLLQGTKAYGSHLHPIPIPAKERAPRDAHENFYWLQEDLLVEKAAEFGFSWTILRPQLVIGGAWGAAMNMVPVIGSYAAICHELGLPFAYPGGAVSVVREAVDARVVAQAIEWAGESPPATNEVFNVTNGDVYEWRTAWPGMARTLGVPTGPDRPQSMVEFFADKGDVWDRIVRRHGLRATSLAELLGQSHHLADTTFAYGVDDMSDPTDWRIAPRFSSRIKLNRAGFTACADTEESLRYWLRQLIARDVIPRLGSDAG